MLRVVLIVALFLSVLYLPWVATLLIALAVLAVRPGYEVIVAGLALDLLYGDSGVYGISTPFLSTLCAVVLFFTAHFIKRNFIRA